MNETRREIAEIVREVAAAVRSDHSADEFLTLLVDRVLRAMAAEGVLVWRRDRCCDGGFRCLRRIGRITDQSISSNSAAAHYRMLWEVAAEGRPVVVPATPGATDPDVPANPSDVPAAVVPIDCQYDAEGAEYLLQAFLEPGCGVATQRGYLRFVAQMADLAGEFLRADQLRRMRRQESLSGQLDHAIRRLHAATDRARLEALVVDQAAELFGFDRVGLCVAGTRIHLASVSHVNSIDRKSPAAEQIRTLAKTHVAEDGCQWFTEQSPVQAGEDLVVRAVVCDQTSGEHRLVCLQSAHAEPISDECREWLVRFMRHAQLALCNASRWDAIPGGRLIASLAPAIQSRNRVGRRLAAFVLIVAVMILAGLFPVPLVVDSPASIRPATVQTLSAPRDCVVDRIHVRHGQRVAGGEILLTLSDPKLEEQITTLVGRRAVLAEQKSHWTTALVDTASSRQDRMEQLQGQQMLVEEEIRSIDDQLVVLDRVQQSLVIRAQRGGVVDAWQMEQRLQSRPLRRGDKLVDVIAHDSAWVIDARVPQTRIAHVQLAERRQDLTARIILDAEPNESFEAELLQIGPAVLTDAQSAAATAVLLRLNDHGTAAITSRHGQAHHAGAPARVMFQCGKTPAAYLLFQDVIRSIRGTLSLYGTPAFAGTPVFAGNTAHAIDTAVSPQSTGGNS